MSCWLYKVSWISKVLRKLRRNFKESSSETEEDPKGGNTGFNQAQRIKPDLLNLRISKIEQSERTRVLQTNTEERQLIKKEATDLIETQY